MPSPIQLSRSPSAGSTWAEGPDQVGGPEFRDLPGDEVAAAGVSGDVDVVVPGGAVACQERLDALFLAVDSRRVLVVDERDPGRCLDDWRPVMGGCPGVAVVVGVRADRAGDGVAGPVDRRVGEQVVAGEHGVDVSAVVGPFHPSFEHPGQHAGRGVGQAVPECARGKQVGGQVHREPPLDLDQSVSLVIGQPGRDGPAAGEIPGTVAGEKVEFQG